MYTPSSIYLLPALLTLNIANACNPTRRDTDPSDVVAIGTDGPAPAETLGFALDHIGLVTTNLTGFQSGAELTSAKNNLWGLLELQQFNVSDDRLLASTERTNTFGHVGLIVPNTVKAQEYFESKGVRILEGRGAS
jgi:lactoylglutathione lyase